MRLTTKMRYGTRALLDLAMNQEAGPVSLKEIARRQEVSVKYIEQLMAALLAAQLVKASHGRRGGYLLSRPISQINLRQVYDVLEGKESFVECSSDPHACPRSGTCITQDVWAQLTAACMGILESTTLEDLAQRARDKDLAADTYYI